MENNQSRDLVSEAIAYAEHRKQRRVEDSFEIKVTPEIAEGAKEILDQLEESNSYSSDIIDLAKKCH